jgi:hypothetical protein
VGVTVGCSSGVRLATIGGAGTTLMTGVTKGKFHWRGERKKTKAATNTRQTTPMMIPATKEAICFVISHHK